MPVLRLFAAAREAAGVARAELDGSTVGAILQQAEDRYGERFSGVLAHSRVWVNGQPAQADTAVHGHDVIAVLPPVSGGSDVDQAWGAKAVAVDPAPEESPVAVVLLEREDDLPDPAAHLEASPGPDTRVEGHPGPHTRVAGTSGPAPGLEDLPSPFSEPAPPEYPAGWPAEPTTEYQPTWPEDLESATLDEPDWLAQDDPRPQPVFPDQERSPYVDGWSGWSSATDSHAAVAPPPVFPPTVLPPVAAAPQSGAGFFAPSPLAPAPPARVPPGAAESGPPAEVLDALDAQLAPAKEGTADSPPAPAAAPKGGLRKAFNRLAVVHDSDGPHGRLGLLWAIITVGAAIGGPESLAGWLGLTAFVGAYQASGVRLGKGHPVLTAVSALTAIALPAAALLGVDAVAAAVGGAAVLAFVAAVFFSRGSATRDGTATFAIGTALGLAAAAPVLLRADYIEASFLLLAYAATYDAGAYLVGTGASSVWEGPVAGVAALIPVVILSAVLLVPPFDPGSPVALGFLAAILAPLGPLVGSALVGGGGAHAPGLRRLDSLIVLGPIWALAAVAFIS